MTGLIQLLIWMAVLAPFAAYSTVRLYLQRQDRRFETHAARFGVRR